MFSFIYKHLVSSKMGNNTSNSASNNSKSTTKTLTDVHRKCVKTFSGTASDDVDIFVSQLQAVRLVYNLSDQLLLELTLEKIEGQALVWLHSRPDLMTLGIDHFKRALLKEFGEGKKVEEEPGIQNAPSAPPKIDVCAEEMRSPTRIYPEITDIEVQLDNLRFEPPPPSYDSVFSGINISKQLELVPQAKETPKSSDAARKQEPVPKTTETPMSLQKNVEKEKVGKMPGQKRRNVRSRAPQLNQPSDFASPKNEPTVSGARPKVPYQKPKTEPSKETSVTDPITPAVKCNYCKEEGHHIRDCKIRPCCQHCGEKHHKNQTCPLLAPSLLGNPLMIDGKSEVSDPATSGLKCNYCKEEGHHIRDCKIRPRCQYCGEKPHKNQICPLLAPSLLGNPLMIDGKSEVSDPATSGLKCNYCKEEGHHIRDCKIRPRCQYCGEKPHKNQICPLLAPGLVGNPLLTEIKSEVKTQAPKGQNKLLLHYPKSPANPESGYCRKCNTIGHHTVNCTRISVKPKSRCYRCNSETHKVHECPIQQPKGKETETECNIM